MDVPCAKTIAKYIPDTRKPPSVKAQQSWRTFIRNNMHNTWAMDFLTVPTLTLRVIYVLVIISHERREIKHIAVAEYLTAEWTVQQLREATPFGEQSRYLIHDNDSIFRSGEVQHFLDVAGIESVKTGYKRPDQNGICERFIGILRHELLDHIVPLNERHLRKLLKEYIDNYYHPARTHKNLDHMPPRARDISAKPLSLSDASLQPQLIVGGLYHSYIAKAAWLDYVLASDRITQATGRMHRHVCSMRETRSRSLYPYYSDGIHCHMGFRLTKSQTFPAPI